MTTRSDNREAHIRKIISEPIRIIESEHGLVGIDHLLAIVQESRNSIVFELEREREGAG